MPEIIYKELDRYIKKITETPEDQKPQAYLLFGEELLYKKAFDALLDSLIPLEDRAVSCETVDGSPEYIREAIHRTNTYAMLQGNKVVAILESRIFYGNQEKDKLLDRAKAAFEKEDTQKSAKYLLSLLGQLRLSLEDAADEENRTLIIPNSVDGSESAWLRTVIDYCIEKGLSVPSNNRPDQFLAKAIEKGFPKGNYLFLTTDMVDKRRALFKCFKERGVAVDCSVPKGNRRADRQVQEEVLKNRMAVILEAGKKSMASQAFELLYDMTGFDLRTFSNNLEKLVLYVGDRPTITPNDVKDVLERSKQDPIYALTGAVADRNPESSLKLIDSLLQGGVHPLQVLSAIVNQFRKLILAKNFVQSDHGRAWQPGMPYQTFSAEVLPAMKAYDEVLFSMLSEWEALLGGNESENRDASVSGKSKKKQRKRKRPEDLLVAANPKNPYPIFLTLKKADNFSMTELTDFYILLGETDMKLKRSGRSPKLILEEIILKICGKEP